MAHHNHATLEIHQIILKHGESHDVEVVCRLVEYQEIRALHQHRGQIKTAALTATEFGNILLLGLGREQELREESRRCEGCLFIYAHHFGNLTHGIDNLLRLVKSGHALLAVIAPADSLADVEAARVRLHQAEQQLDECRFARAVVADYADLLIAGEGIVPVAENHLVAESLGDMPRIENLRADVARLHLQGDIARGEVHAALVLELMEIVYAVLRLRAARLRLAPHPFEFGPQQILHLGEFGAHRFHALVAAAQVIVIVALVGI